MEKIDIDSLNILSIGNTVQLSGMVLSGEGRHLVCFLPGEYDEDYGSKILEMDLDDWKRVIRQTDLMETEVLTSGGDGKLVKAILRKSTRQVEQGISWRVYDRDGYRCRYCHSKGIPMTVDHLVLWEDGGPTIEGNLLTACRKCNKLRGSMPYEEWLGSGGYNRFGNLPYDVDEKNKMLVLTLKDIPLRIHKRKR